jgi:hypothetical protein
MKVIGQIIGIICLYLLSQGCGLSQSDDVVGPWGIRGDLPIAGDFNGDHVNDDVDVFRPSERNWYFDYFRDGTTDRKIGPWGNQGDQPIAGDFDSDGSADDIAVFRQTEGGWYFDYNANGNTDKVTKPWGREGDLPLAGDFDNDGRYDDIGVFRPSETKWYFDFDATGNTDKEIAHWGWSGDLPIPNAADFEGSGRLNNDIGVFRPSVKQWFFDFNANGNTDYDIIPWGWPGDLPIAGDFDRDGWNNDIGVFRPSERKWYYKYLQLGKSLPGMTGGMPPGYVNS